MLLSNAICITFCIVAALYVACISVLTYTRLQENSGSAFQNEMLAMGVHLYHMIYFNVSLLKFSKDTQEDLV